MTAIAGLVQVGRMKVCIVGQGPSAEGRGKEIDACDFVVRLKEFWRFGAVNSGTRIDAWAWYGVAYSSEPAAPPSDCEHWVVHSMAGFCEREKRYGDGFDRLKRVGAVRNGGVLRVIPGRVLKALTAYLGRFPSTGIRAVAMAMEVLEPDTLVLVGFDAATPLGMSCSDARGEPGPACHDLLTEKLALTKLETGTWLGKPCRTAIEWLSRPELSAPLA